MTSEIYVIFLGVFETVSDTALCRGGGGGITTPPGQRRGVPISDQDCVHPHHIDSSDQGAQVRFGTTDWVGVCRQSDVRSSIEFEGVMMSRTNTYKNLYFVLFKVFRVLKGKIHRQLQGSKNMIMCIIFKMEKIRKMFEI